MHATRHWLVAVVMACVLALAPTAALAAGGGGDAHHACYSCDDDHDGVANWRDSDAENGQYVLMSVGLHAVNLALLFAVIYFGAGGAIRDGIRSRALLISRDISDAAKVRDEAAARHAEITNRLAQLEGELAELESRTKREAEAEEVRIRQRAEETAARVAETATRQIQDETSRSKQALRREAVEIAVELAQDILKKQVQAGDQRRLAQEFLSAVQSEGANG